MTLKLVILKDSLGMSVSGERRRAEIRTHWLPILSLCYLMNRLPVSIQFR